MTIADDFMVRGENETEVQEQLYEWARLSEQYGMKSNDGKREYMVMTRIQRREDVRLKLGGEEMKRVDVI